MVIKVKEKDLYVKVEDDANRTIYENICANIIHYELVKNALLRLKKGENVDNKLLRKLEE